MTTPKTLLALSLLALAVGCAPPAVDTAAEGAKLLKRDAEWAALATAGMNADTVASYWSTDALLYQTGQPVLKGRPAIRAFVDQSFKTPGFKIHWVSQAPTFSPDGKMAYMPGSEVTTFPGADGKLVTLYGQGMAIWRVDPDGVWRCAVDIATEAPAPGK